MDFFIQEKIEERASSEMFSEIMKISSGCKKCSFCHSSSCACFHRLSSGSLVKSYFGNCNPLEFCSVPFVLIDKLKQLKGKGRRELILAHLRGISSCNSRH